MANILKIDALTLNKWLEKDDVVLIDVREVFENKAEHINPSSNVPLSEISIQKLNASAYKGKKVILHCHSGRRSMLACEKLISQGITHDIWNLDGGLLAWKEAEFPTECHHKKSLPLDQQVQLTLGFLIFVSVLCGYFISSYWLILPFIISMGLMNAGLTGWCGLAKLIALMPWNKG